MSSHGDDQGLDASPSGSASIHPSIRPSVPPIVRPSIRPSVRSCFVRLSGRPSILLAKKINFPKDGTLEHICTY